MAFAPALAVFVLLGMGLHSTLLTGQQALLIRTVVRHDFELAMQMSESATTLQRINSDVYRLTTLQASGAPGLNVFDSTAELVARTGALADNLERQARDISADDGRAQVLTLVRKVRLYRDAIEVFGSMLELDFTGAVAFIRPFDDNAKDLLKLIGTIADHATRDAATRAETSERLGERIRLTIIGVFATGPLLLFGVTSVLTRATVRSVRQIATATDKVARGDGDVDVMALARGDELGTIVRSLAVFQANVSQIAFLAHHDALTTLPNRVLFHERVRQALMLSGRGQGFAVFCLDLDRFKNVNDTLGHPVGDGLLRQVAERLQACIREGDTVARLGGDEFAMIVLNASDPAAVETLAARVIRMVGAPYEIDGNHISIGTSIGIVLAPANGSEAHELLKNADTALYGAKAAGRGTSCFYEANMNEALQQRRELEMGLRQAIGCEEFTIFYQPLVDAASRQLVAFEALIRWQHPDKGLIAPDVFIPVAEACGLIGAIGQWVLRRACLDAVAWPDCIKIAINLSPLQFKDHALINSIRGALEVSGLPPQRMELEITESVLLQDSAKTLEILRAIKQLGVQIAMDDFGTGYSSLSYLRSFPFDKIKIDRSFIKDLPHDQNSRAIVRAIVGLSDTFGMTVTAEGVETSEQAQQLSLEHCDQLQGYLFGKPMPACDAAALISDMRHAVVPDQTKT